MKLSRISMKNRNFIPQIKKETMSLWHSSLCLITCIKSRTEMTFGSQLIKFPRSDLTSSIMSCLRVDHQQTQEKEKEIHRMLSRTCINLWSCSRSMRLKALTIFFSKNISLATNKRPWDLLQSASLQPFQLTSNLVTRQWLTWGIHQCNLCNMDRMSMLKTCLWITN